MGTSVRGGGRRAGLGWISRVTLAVTLAGASAAATAGVAVAQTAGTGVAAHHPSKAVFVVHQASRPHFGRILVTPKGGHALYYMPTGSCTGSCLSIWPRLVMPRGKTMPRGVRCLGTARFGSHHQLQVTYHGKRLYTFVDDSGHSVNGDGVAGFKVAKVTVCRKK
jgi:predicted lipoprotein with Yx(FWY)xxD motif